MVAVSANGFRICAKLQASFGAGLGAIAVLICNCVQKEFFRK